MDKDYAVCVECSSTVDKGDAVYDDRLLHYLCDMECFYDWVPNNYHEITEYYRTLNVVE